MSQINEALNSFVESLKGSKSGNTINSYKHNISQFLHFLHHRNNGILVYSHIDVISFAEKRCAEGLSKASVRTAIRIINSYSNFLDIGASVKVKEHDFLKDLDDIETELIVLSENAQKQIYKNAFTIYNNRNVSIILLFLETGIKISELVTLNENDIIECNDSKYIRVQSKIERVLPISNQLYSYLINCISIDRKSELPLFKSNSGSRFSIRSVQRMLNINGISSQILRDTYIFNLLEKDVDTYIISQLVGISAMDILIEKFYKNEFKEIEDFQYNYCR